MLESIGKVVTDAGRILMFMLDQVVYGLIPTVYKLIISLANVDLYSNNPVRVQNANAQLTNAMANLIILGNNPEQGFELYNRIINMGNNPTQAPTGELKLGLWND